MRNKLYIINCITIKVSDSVVTSERVGRYATISAVVSVVRDVDA